MKNYIEKIYIKLVKNNEKLFAIATLYMVGDWSIKGYMIRNDGNGLWVSAPHYKKMGFGKWSPIIWTTPEEWKEIQTMIIEEYQKEVDKSFPKNDPYNT